MFRSLAIALAATATVGAGQEASASWKVLVNNDGCDYEARVDIVYLQDGETRHASYRLAPRGGDRLLTDDRGRPIRSDTPSIWFRAIAGKTRWSGIGGGYRLYEDTWTWLPGAYVDFDLICRGNRYDGDAPLPDGHYGPGGMGGGGANPGSPTWTVLKTDLGYLLQSMVSQSPSTVHVCGRSPNRDLAQMGAGFIGGFGAGAGAGAACDAMFAGLTLGLCTLGGALIGGAVGAFVGGEVIDVVDGWRDCAGAVYESRSGTAGIVWDQSSTKSAVKKATADGRALLAVFSDEFLRCGAAARAGRSGQVFGGIGSTRGKAEAAALDVCREIAPGDSCTVVLPGRCNSWLR